MTVLIIKLLIDFLMIGMLGATIYFCFKVNRRIRVLQDSREEFAKLIAQFDVTTKKAQESIEDLQRVSSRVTDSLNERLDKANFLADDLAFMIEKGNKVADKVDNNAPREARSAKSALPPKREPVAGRGGKAKTGDNLSRATGRTPSLSKREAAKKDKVESMLERLGDKKKGDKPPRRAGRASARLRSRAEQELQEAIESGNES